MIISFLSQEASVLMIFCTVCLGADILQAWCYNLLKVYVD